MTDIFDLILREFQERKAYKFKDFAPFFISSIAAHHFNQANRSYNIYTRSGRTVNTRIHIAFVAPPGFSKTYYLEQFLESKNSILGVKPIKTVFQQRMTEASAFGTITRDQNGKTIEVPGVFQEHDRSIIGIEEFANLRDSMEKQSYNLGFTDQLLSALDSGRVRKNLAAGKISYETDATLWIATQPMRMDMASGMSRRFIYVNFLPKGKDKVHISDAQWEGENIHARNNSVGFIREEIGLLMNNISVKGGIERVSFADEFKSYFDREKIPHFERSLYQNLCLGYTLMRYGTSRELNIVIDNTMEKMMNNEKNWRRDIKRGPVEIMLVNLVETEQMIPHEELIERMSEYSVDVEETERIIKRVVNKKIKKEMSGGKPCYILC